jgi:hypothetical protein
VITIRVGDGTPPPWEIKEANKVITIEEPSAAPIARGCSKEIAMAARQDRVRDMSPWRRHALTIPPDSFDAWARLVVWECWMGHARVRALSVAAHLIRTAPNSIITVFDLRNCYAAAPVIQPCERVAYRAGA